MNNRAALLIGAALTAFIANPVFAQPAKPATPAPAATAQSAVKIGYVNMAKIAAESKSGKAAAASLKTKSEQLRTKIQAKQKQIEAEKKAIEAKIEKMSVKERETKAKDFQKKLEEYQKLVQSSDAEMQKMQEKLLSDLYQKIKTASAAYAKANGYTAILEEKAVLYMSAAMVPKDLTNEISAQIDKK